MTKLGTSHLGENEKHCGQEIKRTCLFRDIALSSKCIYAVQHRENSKCTVLNAIQWLWSYLVQTCGCCSTKWRTSSATGPCCYWSRCSVWRIGLWTASSALLLGQARGSGRLESSIWGWLAKGKVWEKRWCCQALGWKVANGANHFWRLLHLPRQRHDDGRFQEDRILTFQGTT